MVGQSFSHYRVLGRLGEGGMGVVYLAEDTLLGRRVAIKFPNAHGRSRYQLLAEARTASSLNHPAIAAIHDCGEVDGRPYVVMEFVEGENLGHLLSRGAIPPRRALEIAGQVASALAEAHRRHIVHRDIKPSNIHINQRGDVKVLDFGLARSLVEATAAGTGSASLANTRSVEGSLSGTPRYMSPEQARGVRADPRSDLFSLGVVLWESLTGKPAFTGTTAMDVICQVLQADPPPPSQLNPSVPVVLDRITEKALAKDPDARYQCAEDLLADIESARLTLGETTTRSALGGTTRTTLPPETSPARPRRRRFWIAAALCTIAAAAAILLIVRPRLREPDPRAVRWYQEGANAIRDATYYKASKALERAVAIDPRFALAHARLAEASDELDDTARAREEMLNAVAPSSGGSRLSRLDELAIEAVRRGLTRDFAGAAALYRDMLSRVSDAEKASIYLDLGRAYENASKPKEALDSYREAARRAPQYAAAFLRIGVLERRAQRFAEAGAAFAEAESLYRTLSNIEGLTEVMYERSIMANKRGNIQEADSFVAQALQLARTSGNLHQQIAALLQLSNIEYQKGDTAEAGKQAAGAVDLARGNGLELLAAGGLLDLGNAHFVSGDLTQANRYFLESLQFARRFQSRRIEARALLSLGSLRIQQSQLADGIRDVEMALRLYAQEGDAKEQSTALVLLGRARRDRGDYAGALRAFQDQLALATKAGDEGQRSTAQEGIATVLEYQERYPEALANYREAYAADTSRGDRLGMGYDLAGIGRLLADLGRFREARASLAEAAAIAGHSGGYGALARIIELYQAQIALAERRFSAAREAARKLLASSAGLEGSALIETKQIYAAALLAAGARREALEACAQALELGRKSGIPRLADAALLSWSAALLENGEPGKARDAALTAARDFARAGQRESETRAWLIAARAADASGDRAGSRELAAAAAASFKSFHDGWAAQDTSSYGARPDIRYWRTQLDHLTTRR